MLASRVVSRLMPGWVVFGGIAAIVSIAACSGGGGGSHAPVIPLAGPSSQSQAKGTAPVTMTLRIEAPSNASSNSTAHRSPAYIPGSTGQIIVTVLSVNGSPAQVNPTTVNVSPGTGGCSTVFSGNYTCTVTVPLPAGIDLLQITARAGTSGPYLSQYAGTLTVNQGQSNSLGSAGSPVVFDAVPGPVSATPGSNATAIPSFFTPTQFKRGAAGTMDLKLVPLNGQGSPFPSITPPGMPRYSVSLSNPTATASMSPGTLLTIGAAATQLFTAVVVEAEPAPTPDLNTTLAAPSVANTYPSTITVASAAGLYAGAMVTIDYGGLACYQVTQESLQANTISGNTITFNQAMTYPHAVGAIVRHYPDNLAPVATLFGVGLLTQSITLPSPSGGYGSPFGLDVDPKCDNVYVADSGNNRILKMQPGGIPTALPQPAGGFTNPQGVAVDSQQDVLVADTGNNRVMYYQGGLGTPAPLPTPVGRAFSAPNNVMVRVNQFAINWWVTDASPAVYSSLSATTAPAPMATPAGGYKLPVALAMSNYGNIIAADSQYPGILQYNGNGLSPVVLAAPSGGWQGSPGLQGITVGPVYDGINEKLYSVDATAKTIYSQFGYPGGYSSPVAAGLTPPYGVWATPERMSLDNYGTLFVTDIGANAVVAIPNQR